MILLVSACNIPWWLLLLGLVVPAILAWLLRGAFINDDNDLLKRKVFKLEAELKKCYEDKMRITTTHVSPEVKFTDLPPSTYSKNKPSADKLKVATKSKDGDLTTSQDDGAKKGETARSEDQESESADVSSSKSSNIPVQEKSKIKTDHSLAALGSTNYPKLANNLQVCEGIGPKMEEILKENGIESWAELADKTPKSLRAILDKYGDRYKFIDPKDWPNQAKFAASDDWPGLIALQEKLGGTSGSKTNAKARKILSKFGYVKKYKKDDLKAIEGIGPKIETLLKAAGISTWKTLSETKTSTLENILSKAGPRYKLANPDSWPTQAKLAADDNMIGLEQLQSKLKGGK